MANSLFKLVLAALLTFSAVFALAETWYQPPANTPQTEIGNGVLHLKIYLPDGKLGYYRGTRFDWGGMIGALEYKGHNYYGTWFSRIDLGVHNYEYKGTEIVGSPGTAGIGPCDEFQTNRSALGYDEAKVGDHFIKIGVGVLKKDDTKYDYVKQYEILDPGKWTIEKHADSMEFTHELSDPVMGYSYLYHKTIRLVPGKPEMVLEHRLKNTGHRVIQTSVYAHNFTVLDGQGPGPDFSFTVPFQIQTPRPLDKNLAEIRGNQLVYLKPLTDQDMVAALITGFSDSPKDNEQRIENRRLGAGMLIRENRPLSRMVFWSIRSVLAVEPYIDMTIEPGSEFTWEINYQYYTLPPSPK